MTKTLKLVFTTDYEEKPFTLSLAYPSEDATSENIEALMNYVVQNNVFVQGGRRPTGIKAYYFRTENTVVLAKNEGWFVLAVEKDLAVSIDLKLIKSYDHVNKKYTYVTKSVSHINPAVSSDVLYALGEKLGAFFEEYGFGGVVRKESFFITD